MSIIAVGGSGVYLPPNPNSLTWTGLNGANSIDLPAATNWIIPAGTWLVTPGRYTMVQWYDPISQIWRAVSSWNRFVTVNSDGVNFRVANPTGTVVGAVITNAGSGYTSAPTVTASAGGSTWQAIINSSATGWSISSTVTITAAGSGYTLPPIVLISAPAPGGVQATAVAALTAGAVTSITVSNNGAGYTSAPTVKLIPNPLDPAAVAGTIVTATATTALGTTGAVAALRCTYGGTAVTALPTLTFAGGNPGASAAATAVGCFTVTTVTTSAGGVAVPGTVAQINTVGGVTTAALSPAASYLNPNMGLGQFIPRVGNIYAPVSGGVVGSGIIVDGGLFYDAPTPMITHAATTSALLPTTAPAATFAIGGVADSFLIQATL